MNATIEDRGELGDRGELAKRSRLSWRRKPKLTGLFGMLNNRTRGWDLHRGEECLASVGVCADGRFYWAAPSCDLWRWKNTAAEGLYFGSPKAAKAHCVDWVKAQLAAKEARR